MPYKTSRARRNLQIAYLDIDARLRAVNNSRIDPQIRDYVIAAAIFLAHAELENFIADIFSDFAAGAQAIATKGSQLPEELQSYLFLSKANAQTIFGNYVANKSEKEFIKSFITSLRGIAGTIVNDSVQLAQFTGRDIYGKQKYPSEDNLKKIFYRIGIDKVFDKLNSQIKQDSAALLESFASLRTQLAHTGVLPGVSCGDVRDRIRNIERFVGAMDRLIYKTMTSRFGPSVWASHVC